MLIVTVGGCLTIMFCTEEVIAPHEFVIVTETLYVPGVTKLNDGLADVALVPLVKLHVGVPLPQ